jgi:hypothetical protein
MDSNMQLNTSGVSHYRDKNIDVDPVSDIIKRPLQEVIWDLVLTWLYLLSQNIQITASVLTWVYKAFQTSRDLDL